MEVKFYFSYGGGEGRGLKSPNDRITSCRSKRLILQPSNFMSFTQCFTGPDLFGSGKK